MVTRGSVSSEWRCGAGGDSGGERMRGRALRRWAVQGEEDRVAFDYNQSPTLVIFLDRGVFRGVQRVYMCFFSLLFGMQRSCTYKFLCPLILSLPSFLSLFARTSLFCICLTVFLFLAIAIS